MTFSKSDRLVVTGGGGFVGTALVRKLKERGYSDVVIVRRKDFDLATGLKIRASFAFLGYTESAIVLAAPELACDRDSLRLIAEELDELYSAPAAARPATNDLRCIALPLLHTVGLSRQTATLSTVANATQAR